MKGKVNIWTNLRTMWKGLVSREFKPLRMAVLSQIFFIIIFTELGIVVFYHHAVPTYAATYAFIQSSWNGGASTTASGLHPTNTTNWTYFYSASSTITAGGNVRLDIIPMTDTETSDVDFDAGTPSNMYRSGTNSSASLVLFKPIGASCTQASQCSSELCTSNLCAEPPCTGSNWSISYSGQTYSLVLIGSQCWFSQNLNVGTKLASGTTTPSNNSLIEKWCYNNDDAQCTTYGGLYTWAEANQLATTCNTTSCTPSSTSQGICPSDWHIPTDTEFKTLETYLGICAGAGAGCVDATGFRGTTQGTQLKSGGSSGFNVSLGGYRLPDGSFTNQGTSNAYWFTSEFSASISWNRSFTSSEARVSRSTSAKTLSFSVRCLKN